MGNQWKQAAPTPVLTTPPHPLSLTKLTVITRGQFVSLLDGLSFRNCCRGHKTNLSSQAPV